MPSQISPRSRAFAALTLAAISCLLSGCLATKSEAWKIATGSLDGKLKTDECLPYARALDKEFTKANIPHQVAYIQWRSGYDSLSPKAGVSGLHAIVLYKDETNPAFPWWGVDNESEPVWLKAQNPLAAAYEFGYATGVDYVRVESIGVEPRTKLGSILLGKKIKPAKKSRRSI
jgi:hypothetical protein